MGTPFGFIAVNDGTYGGVYYTAAFTLSGAITWAKLTTTGLASLGITEFKADPFDPLNRQYVVANNIIYGRNAGDWTSLLTMANALVLVGKTPQTNRALGWLAVDLMNAGTLFCLLQNDNAKDQGVFILKSTDYGATWADLWEPPGPGFNIVDMQAVGETIWVAHNVNPGIANYRIVYTGDSGATSSTSNFNIVGGITMRYPWDASQALATLNTTTDDDLYRWDFGGASPYYTLLQKNINNEISGSIWVDPFIENHERTALGDSVFYTADGWVNKTEIPITGFTGETSTYQLTHIQNTGSATEVIIARSRGTAGAGTGVWTLDSEADTTALIRNGANHASAPYADSVPSDLFLANRTPIWVGEAPSVTGVYVYSVEMESDTGWATDVTDYDKIGSPMGGDRSSFRDMPADGFDVYHAEDVHAATPQIHAPWDEASPPGAGYGIISDGTKWEVSSAPLATTGSLHDAVTLDADAANILDLQGAGGQEIGLDVQTANTVLAGPTTGAANEPTFRALVAADVGTGTPDTTKYLRDDMSWQVVTTHDTITLDADAATILDLQGAGGQEIGLDVQTANTVFAGPVSGAANEPTFRALVFSDIPNRKVDTITSDTTLDDTYDVVIVDASGGDVTVTLPDAMLNDGKEYAIKRIDSSANSVTIHPTVNYLVDDSGDYLIDDDGAYLIDDGSTNLEGEANGLDIDQYTAIQIVADADADSWWII